MDDCSAALKPAVMEQRSPQSAEHRIPSCPAHGFREASYPQTPSAVTYLSVSPEHWQVISQAPLPFLLLYSSPGPQHWWILFGINIIGIENLLKVPYRF